MEIMKVVGYSEAGDTGALTFPPDQRIAPDRSKIGLIAAELLITKTDLMNHPISHRSSSSPYTPLEHMEYPTPKPNARTMVQLTKGEDPTTDTIIESMGFSTAKSQQPLSISQESSYYASDGRLFQTPHWDEDGSVAEEVRECREDEVEVLRHNEYTHTPNVYSEAASVTNIDEEDDEEDDEVEEGDDEDNQLKKLRQVLSDMKKVHAHVPTGTTSAPTSPFKQRKVQPVPKKGTVFLTLSTLEGESSRPAFKPSSHERQQTYTTTIPMVSQPSAVHEVTPTQNKSSHSEGHIMHGNLVYLCTCTSPFAYLSFSFSSFLFILHLSFYFCSSLWFTSIMLYMMCLCMWLGVGSL